MLPPPLFHKESGYADCLGFVECGDVLYCLLCFCGDFGVTNFSLEEKVSKPVLFCGTFGLVPFYFEEKMKKYVLFTKIDESIIPVMYSSLDELHAANPGVIHRDEYGEVCVVDKTKYLIMEVGYIWSEKALEVADVDCYDLNHLIPLNFEEDEDVDSSPTDDDWINVTINGLEIKVPPGTTQEDVQNALASASGYEDPTISWCG